MTATFYKYNWILFFLVSTLVSCAQTHNTNAIRNTTSLVKEYTVDTSLIAIIPMSTSESWIFDKTYAPATLTKTDIEKIEKLLIDCVKAYNNKLSGSNKQYASIDFQKEKYRRQYVAVTNKKGEKEVWVNCLCQTEGEEWKKVVSLVDDGGSCFFNLKINLSTEKYYDLIVNGEA